MIAMHKRLILSALLGCTASIAYVGCTSGDDAEERSDRPESSVSPKAPKASSDGETEDLAVPADFEAAAETSIGAENLDQQVESLEKEIDADSN